jgi:hypothetical protein
MRRNSKLSFSENDMRVSDSVPPDAFGHVASIKKACREWERRKGIKSNSFMPRFVNQKVENKNKDGHSHK